MAKTYEKKITTSHKVGGKHSGWGSSGNSTNKGKTSPRLKGSASKRASS